MSLLSGLSHMINWVTLMNRRFIFFLNGSRSKFFLYFVYCAAAFLCGIFLGAFASADVSDSDSVFEYFYQMISLLQSGSQVNSGFFENLFDLSKYHLAALFFAFSVFGVFLIPGFAVVRGFLFSFAVSSAIRVMGGESLFLVLSMFGVTAVFSVTTYIFVSAVSLSASADLFLKLKCNTDGKAFSAFSGGFFVSCFVCFLVLVAAALLETYVAPYFVKMAAGF